MNINALKRNSLKKQGYESFSLFLAGVVSVAKQFFELVDKKKQIASGFQIPAGCPFRNRTRSTAKEGSQKIDGHGIGRAAVFGNKQPRSKVTDRLAPWM